MMKKAALTERGQYLFMKDLIVNGLYSERSRIHFDQIQESHRHNQIIPRAFFQSGLRGVDL